MKIILLILILVTTTQFGYSISEPDLLNPTNPSIDTNTNTNTNNLIESSSKKRPKLKNWSCVNCLWIGGGAHYLVFQQKAPSNVSSINYSHIGFPSTWIEFRAKVFGAYGLNGEFQTQPSGSIMSSTLNLVDSKINWTYSTLGLDYRSKNGFKFLNYIWANRFLLALQKHSMPFLKEVQSKQYSIVPIQFSTLSFGLYFDILGSKDWHYIMTNRLQFPIQSQSEITVTGGLSFDGTLGAVYHLNPQMALAFYWGGQYHGLKYKTQTEADVKNYTLWTSKISTLIGYYF